MTNEAINEDYNAGLLAKSKGLPKSANPHLNKPTPNRQAIQWDRGWDAGIPPTTAPPVTTVTPAPPSCNSRTTEGRRW